MLKELGIQPEDLTGEPREYWETVDKVDSLFRGCGIELTLKEAQFLYQKKGLGRYYAFLKSYEVGNNTVDSALGQTALIIACRHVMRLKSPGGTMRSVRKDGTSFWVSLSNKVNATFSQVGNNIFGDSGEEIMEQFADLLYGDINPDSRNKNTIYRKPSVEERRHREASLKNFVEKYSKHDQ